MPANIINIKLNLEEEIIPSDKYIFHYTHGLKDHYGNCQRLFHGHRNTVDIYVNGLLCPESERELTQTILSNHVHFCFWENVTNQDEIIKACQTSLPEGLYSEVPQVHISYKASQGQFNGSLPGSTVYFLQEESTVENLAIHFAKKMKHLQESQRPRNKRKQITVHAYEGIGKGAQVTL